MDEDERKDKKQATVSTINKCLRQGNVNKLTEKTDREEGKRRKQRRRGQTVLGRGITT